MESANVAASALLLQALLPKNSWNCFFDLKHSAMCEKIQLNLRKSMYDGHNSKQFQNALALNCIKWNTMYRSAFQPDVLYTPG